MIRRIVPFARGKQEQELPPLGRFFFGWLAFVCSWGILLFPSGTTAAPSGQISVQQSVSENEDEDVLRLAWKAGQQLCLEGRFTKAVAYLRQYVKERPRSADGWYWLGKAQEGAGNLEKAQEAYRTALEVDPEYPALSRILAAHEDGNALPLWDPAQQPFGAQPIIPKGQAYYIAPQVHPVEVLVPQGVVQGPAPQMLPMAAPGTFPQQGGVVPIMPSPQGMVVPPGGVPRIELSEPFPSLSEQQEQLEPVFTDPSPSSNKPSSTRPRVPLSSPVVVKPATPLPSGEQQHPSSSKSVPVYVPPAPTSQSGTSTATGTPLPQQNLSLSPAQPSEEETPIPQTPLYMPPVPSEGAPTVPLQDPPTIPPATPGSPVFLPPTPATPQQPSLDRFSPSATTDLESVPQALSGDVSQDNNTAPDSD
jgi:hypothetical protein